jgi:hypothetical protein
MHSEPAIEALAPPVPALGLNVFVAERSHPERRAAAYEHAAGVHRRAERTEANAAGFFAAHGDERSAARHRALAARQRQLAADDDARAQRARRDGCP